jgi:hypothetical protein
MTESGWFTPHLPVPEPVPVDEDEFGDTLRIERPEEQK